jgi:hypothetical protein
VPNKNVSPHVVLSLLRWNSILAVVFAIFIVNSILPIAKADGWKLYSTSLSGSMTTNTGTVSLDTGTVLAGKKSSNPSPYLVGTEILITGGSSITGSLTETYQYSGSTVPTSAPFHVYSNTMVNWGDQATVSSITLNDGLGDSTITGGYYDETGGYTADPYTDQSRGEHIMTESVSNGTVTITVPFTASIDGGNATVIMLIGPDTRYGSISSSLGTTYQKVTDNSGNVSRVADTIKGDTLTQTTAIPDSGTCEQITYTGNAIGAWSSNSTWLLHVKSVDTDGALLNDYIVDGTNQASSGTFSSPGAVGIFWFPYFNQFDDGIYGNVTNSIFATGGSNQEHVKMTLTDGSDGSIYGFNYYLIFHQAWENAQQLPQTEITNWGNTAYTWINLQSTTGASPVVNVSASASLSLTNTLSAGFTSASAELLNIPFLSNITTTVGTSASAAANISATIQSVQVPSNEEVCLWAYVQYPMNNYLVDQYGTDGYDTTPTEGLRGTMNGFGLTWSAPYDPNDPPVQPTTT